MGIMQEFKLYSVQAYFLQYHGFRSNFQYMKHHLYSSKSHRLFLTRAHVSVATDSSTFCSSTSYFLLSFSNRSQLSRIPNMKVATTINSERRFSSASLSLQTLLCRKGFIFAAHLWVVFKLAKFFAWCVNTTSTPNMRLDPTKGGLFKAGRIVGQEDVLSRYENKIF